MGTLIPVLLNSLLFHDLGQGTTLLNDTWGDMMIEMLTLQISSFCRLQ